MQIGETYAGNVTAGMVVCVPPSDQTGMLAYTASVVCRTILDSDKIQFVYAHDNPANTVIDVYKQSDKVKVQIA